MPWVFAVVMFAVILLDIFIFDLVYYEGGEINGDLFFLWFWVLFIANIVWRLIGPVKVG